MDAHDFGVGGDRVARENGSRESSVLAEEDRRNPREVKWIVVARQCGNVATCSSVSAKVRLAVAPTSTSTLVSQERGGGLVSDRHLPHLLDESVHLSVQR